MRYFRRPTAVVAALSLIVSTMTGSTMACDLMGRGTPGSGQADVATHHEHAAPAAASVGHGAHDLLAHAESNPARAGADASPSAPESQDSPQSSCPAMGPCAFVLLGAGAAERISAILPPVLAAAISELPPASRTLVPDLPPPKA